VKASGVTRNPAKIKPPLTIVEFLALSAAERAALTAAAVPLLAAGDVLITIGGALTVATLAVLIIGCL
jgi:hypothetical protein